MSGTSRTTRIGILGSPHRAAVDERGTVLVDGRPPVEWWIGAEDRWHLAPVERRGRVRQWLVDDMPVVATALRVPGGEVVHRAFGVRVGGRDVVAIEVENTSPVPVGLALVGDVTLAREPAKVDHTPDGRRISIVPVTHNTTTHAIVAIDGGEVAPPSVVPTAAQVASGWRRQVARGLQVVLPDEALQHAVDAGRAQLLLTATVADARALLQQGFTVEAEQLLIDAVLAAERTRGTLDVDELVGLATLWRVARNDKLADATAPLVRATLRRADRLPTARPRPPTAPDRLRALLVDDARDRCLALLPLVPSGWLGQGLEVHDAPTAAGTLSFALRWHGARPALLWDLQPHDGDHDRGITMTAPGLDPTWSNTERRGEALLAPVPPPGVMPKVYGAREGARGVSAPDVGESYS